MPNARNRHHHYGPWSTKLQHGAGVAISDPATGRRVALLRVSTPQPGVQVGITLIGQYQWRRMSVDEMARACEDNQTSGQDGDAGLDGLNPDR